MSVKSNLILVFVGLLLVVGCVEKDKNNFYKISQDLYAKRVGIGEKAVPLKNKDIIYSFAVYNKFNVAIPLKNYHSNDVYCDTVSFDDLANNSLLQTILSFHAKEDSSIFKMPARVFSSHKDWEPAIELASNEEVFVYLKTINILLNKELEKNKSAEKNYSNYLKVEENTELTNFIKKNSSLSFSQKDSFFYKATTQNGNGRKVKSGDVLEVYYVGKFLDNKVFDKISEPESPFEFKVGTPDQLIKGLEKGILSMQENEKAVFVFSSKYGFGAKGNSNGIVEPYKCLTFEVFLKNIK